MVWYGTVYGTVWYGMTQYSMVCYRMVWYGTVWYGVSIGWVYVHTARVTGSDVRKARFRLPTLRGAGLEDGLRKPRQLYDTAAATTRTR